MRTYTDILYLLAVGTAMVSGLLLLLRRERSPKAARNAKGTPSEPESAEVVERIAALEADLKAYRRKFDDLDESVDHRFRRLAARKRRDPEPEETEEVGDGESAPLLPFGVTNRRVNLPPQAANGRPFGRSFGPNRG